MAARGSSRRILPALLVLAMLLLSGCVARNAEDTPQVTTEIPLIEATQDETGGARITWNDHPPGVLAKYEVLRDGQVIATLQAPTRAYVDDAVQAGETYTYRIRGYYPDGTVGPLSPEESVTLHRSLALVQDETLGRGYVNLSVLSRSPGLHWDELTVRVNDQVVPPSPSGVLTDGTWAHTDRQDDLVDLSDVLSLRSTDLIRHNATLTVTTEDGEELYRARLEGRPTMNLTVRQERDANQGAVTLVVTDLSWTDRGREITPQDATLRHRWSELTVYVNGTLIRYHEDGNDRTWSHEVPRDDVIREGERLTIRYSDLLGPGTRVVLYDAVALGPAFDLIVQ